MKDIKDTIYDIIAYDEYAVGITELLLDRRYMMSN